MYRAAVPNEALQTYSEKGKAWYSMLAPVSGPVSAFSHRARFKSQPSFGVPSLPLHSYTPLAPSPSSQYHNLPRPPGIITPLPPPLYLVTVGSWTKDTWNAEFKL